MSKQDVIEFQGEVIDVFPGARFRVRLEESERELDCIVNGRIRKNNIRIVLGDKVTVELSPYDLTLGRISYRH
jgi:translation initiation factor IF-1